MKRLALWAVILAAVALAVIGRDRLEEPAQDGKAARLVVELQAKLLFGVERLQPGAAAASLVDLERSATTPETAAVVAALELALGRDAQHARALVAAHPSANVELAQAIDTAISAPATLSKAQSALLDERIGVGATFLRSRAEPKNAAITATLDRIATRAIALAGVLGIVVFLGGGSGLVLLFVAVVRRKQGQLTMAFVPRIETADALLEGAALYLALFAVFEVALPLVGVESSTLALVGLALSSAAGVLWPLWRSGPAALGAHGGRGLWREIGSGVVGYVAILPIAGIGLGLSMLALQIADRLGVGPAGDELPTHPIVVWIAESSFSQLLAVLVFASIFAPVMEELVFRGALFGSLRARHGYWISALTSGLVFAILHPQGLYLVPALLGLAMGFALLREWRGSIVAPIVAHGLHNGALVLVLWTVLASE